MLKLDATSNGRRTQPGNLDGAGGVGRISSCAGFIA
jgi:hypothetical protein